MALFDFLGLKRGVQNIVAQIDSMRQRLEKLRREREDVAGAPSAREDAIATWNKLIDDAGAAYPKNLASVANIFHSNGGKLNNMLKHEVSWGMLLGTHSNGNVSAIVPALAFLLRDDIKAGIARALNEMPWPANAMTLEKRAKVGLMGHNKGRDNAQKRAKRRRKHERLASAKQPSRDATARQGKKAAK